jgi:hypothetical protein
MRDENERRTLTSALRALHAAGRVRSPWLPGMRGIDKNGCPFRMGHPHRCGDWFVFDERMVDRLTPVGFAFLALVQPDTSDPATVGCLLALLREASGDPGMCTERWESVNSIAGYSWAVRGYDYLSMPHPTEGGAIGAALVALAEGL